MADYDNLSDMLQEEKNARGLASLAFMIIAVLSFFAALVIDSPILDIDPITLQTIFYITAGICVIGSIVARFSKSKGYENRY